MTILMTLAAAAVATMEVTIPGPKGPLGGALTDPGKRAPLVILVPGSGPTDRDGNNPLGVKGGVYKQLGDALAAKGVATLRIDKRGMFSSKAAVADPNAAHIADYAADVHGWAAFAKARGKRCAWIAGHSEGGLIALAAAQNPKDICGLILISAMGRPLGQVLRDQLKPQLPPEMMVPVEAAIVNLESGKPVDLATIPAPLKALFAPQVQGYLGEMARPDATLTLLPGVNHVLKQVGNDKAANMASYADDKLRIDARVAEAIAAFVTKTR